MSVRSNYNYFSVSSSFVDNEKDEILSTQSETCVLDQITPELSKNLKIARETINYVQKSILYSTTYPLRSKNQQVNFSKLGRLLDSLRDQLIPVLQADLLSFRLGVMLLKKIQIGDCYEMACVGLDFLLQCYPKIKSARCAIRNGDHVFLTIGVGKDAVICDPWCSSYYPKVEISKYLFDYVGIKEVDDKIFTIVVKYDPFKQSLYEYPNPKNKSIS